MELEKLKSFDQLQVGDKVTRITLTGFQIFMYMGDDPHTKNPEHKNKYGYFLDSFGRESVERWYVGYLDKKNIYIGYDSDFVKRIEIELLEAKLKELKAEIGEQTSVSEQTKESEYPLAFITSAGGLKLKRHSELSADGTPRYLANPNSDATYCLQDCMKDYTPIWSQKFLDDCIKYQK